MAPADVGFLRVGGVDLGLLVLKLNFIEPGAQHRPGGGAVLVLGTLALTGNDDAGGEMGDAHRAVGSVDVLAAGTGGAIGVDADILVRNFDLDVDRR